MHILLQKLSFTFKKFQVSYILAYPIMRLFHEMLFLLSLVGDRSHLKEYLEHICLNMISAEVNLSFPGFINMDPIQISAQSVTL